MQRSTLALFFTFVICVSGEAATGRLTGRVRDEQTGAPLRRTMVSACKYGRSIAQLAMTDNDGVYLFGALEAGSYAVSVMPENGYRPACVAQVEIKEGTATDLNLSARRSLAIEGDSWLQAYPSFGQSFRATGLGVTGVQFKAFGPQRRVIFKLLEGDGISGRLVGPERISEPVGGEGSTLVSWAGSELPTVPGEMYTLVMTARSGEKLVPAVAGRGDVYSGGQAYFGDSPRPHSDLGIAISEDNDGMRTCYAVTGGGRMYRAISAGQTFVALSRSITFAAAEMSGLEKQSAYVRFSIHRRGPGGAQIGPSKVVPPGVGAAVAWGPGEVPVVPGKSYYLHVESTGSVHFLIARTAGTYSSGHAVLNGRAAPGYDLNAVIAGEICRDDFERLVRHRLHKRSITLVNPSFEESAFGWKRSGTAGKVAGVDDGTAPSWGSKMFGWTNRKKGQDSRTFVFQHAAVSKGHSYSFSASVFTGQAGGRASDVKVRLIAVPDGSEALTDAGRITTSQWYATEGVWRRGSVQFRAVSDSVVVGFDLEQRFSLEKSSLYVDGAYLEEIGE